MPVDLITACAQALYGSVYPMMATIKGTTDSECMDPKGHGRMSDNIICYAELSKHVQQTMVSH